MKGNLFGAGPVHSNGTRHYSRLANGSKAEVATGRASGKLLGPPLPAWMSDRTDLPCKQPGNDVRWWFAPEEDVEEELNADGERVVISRTRISTSADADKAAELCRTCPMRLPCGEHGLTSEGFGTWGGIRLDSLKVEQRRDLLARLRREQGRRAS